ncbi:helix-turn-helix domain-containing protein [Comamonas sp. Y33R10-2]|uniref:helix-turn-helix domain-containing protein n=1 Tax=Comamonas sp. Y33R10-2 TaxID=2853257 RepID=UPI001C5CACE3|nr:helix-turn-helix transcriptional regulator [Comamonas sp. Y33R10-2]QXZ10950.1 helix-turn-helix domain-containing protein [Comamonas sp. Y33R10-2]
MRAFEWIDRAKNAAKIESDYAIAKILGIHRATVSNYRKSSGLLDVEVSIKVAEIMGIPPEKILLDQLAESVKTPAAKAALERFCILC